MYQIRKSWKVEMAHRLTTAHTKACSDCIHGHSYTIEVFIMAEKLNEDGMVIDFGALGELKDIVMQCDHALMLQQLAAGEKHLNHKLIQVPFNPTAENMARWLYEQMSCTTIFCGQNRLLLDAVRVWETETGYAEYFDHE